MPEAVRRGGAAPPRAGRMPGAWPGLGNLPALRHGPLAFLDSLAPHGDLVEVRLGSMPAFVLGHPGLIHEVMTDDRAYDRDGPLYARSRQALGNSLATCPHADHRRQRRMLQPAFRNERMAGYAAVIQRSVGETLAGWHPGRVVDLGAEFFGLATRAAVGALFTADPDARVREGLQRSLDTFLRGVYWHSLAPWSARLPLPANRRYARALASWRRYGATLIDAARTGAPGRGGAHDVLTHLLAARDDDGSPVPEDEIQDQVTALVLAGSETTAAGMSWACHLVATHPEVERRLQAEADEVLGGRLASWEDLPRLGLAARVVHEALRLYPPAWVIPRVTTRPTVLAGRRLPPGSTVLFTPYLVHRRADLHSDPLRFLPDRWPADAGRGGRPLSTGGGAHVPFGEGAHRCVGETFALVEAVLAVASVAARWSLRPLPGAGPVRPAARAVLAPRSLPVRLVPR
jgi:cytochrome P450